MKVFEAKPELLSYLSIIREKKTIGFVPTMGALHNGHLSLIKASKKTCDITVCSIFVNPTQFNNIDDLNHYPKTIKSDLKKLKMLDCDIVYMPIIADLYKEDLKAKKFDFGIISSTMEGRFREGHFNGVATIVEKLFNIINPTKAFFGEKDLQQLYVVKELVRQIGSSVEIIGMPTIREKNGLAMSSRNKLLSKKGAKDASLINKCLLYCNDNYFKGVEALKQYIEKEFDNHSNIMLEYVEFIELKNMRPIKDFKAKGQNAICIAIYIDGIRLIDNIIL